MEHRIYHIEERSDIMLEYHQSSMEDLRVYHCHIPTALATAALEMEARAATRCSTIVVVVASQGRGCDGEVPRVVLASDAPDCNNAVVVVMF